MPVMKRLAEKFAGNPDVALVTLVLDPGPADGLEKELANFSEKIGAKLPQWTVGSNERPTLHKFIKNEFKANMLPHEKDGKWLYDDSLVLIDKNRHVRRAVVPQVKRSKSEVISFDFSQAKEWDENLIKTGTDKNNVEQMEVLLGDTIGILLNEKVEAEEGNSPTTPLYVGIGFVLLFVFIVIRSRISGNQEKL